MGWGSGSQIANDVWENVRPYIPEKKREVVAGMILDVFWNADCDTLYELIDDNRPEIELALRGIGYLDDDD